MTTFVPFARRIDRDWAHLTRRPELVRRARRWDVSAHPFTSLDELLVLAGLTGPRARGAAAAPADAEEADGVLHRLVLRSPDDWLAGRAVLQRILGGLLALAGAEQRRDPTIDALSLLVGEAWVAITRYSPTRPGRDVAARLLSDARHRAFTGPRRRRRVDEVLAPPWRLGEPSIAPDRSPCDEVASVLRDARDRGLAEADLALVTALLDGGTATVALGLGVTDRTVRNRRERATATIRELVA
jgi:hypothetical protein